MAISDQEGNFKIQRLCGFPEMGGVELALATEKAGGGGAVDADEFAPLGSSHSDVFEVGGKELN
jgi:hypothetical protein